MSKHTTTHRPHGSGLGSPLLTSQTLPNTLPARMAVPPLPPRLHRRLVLTTTPDGVLVKPKGVATSSDDPAVLVQWGVKGRVEAYDSAQASTGDADGEAEIGGVLGVVRLWDAAYLAVFLPATKAPTRLFPNDDPFGESEYITHEVFTLSDVHFVPLASERAKAQVAHLSKVMAKRAPKPKPKATGHSRTPSAWRMLWSPASRAPESQASSDSDSDDDEDDIDDDDDDGEVDSANISRRSSIPEADETIPALPPVVDNTPEARVKRRLSLGWGRFKPRLGIPKLQPKGTPKQDSKGDKSDGDGGDGEELAELPTLTVEPPLDTVEEDKPLPAPTPRRAEPLSPLSRTDAPLRSTTPAPPPVDAPQRKALESKILKQMQQELGSGEFYYSYEFDSSHSLQYKRNRLASRQTSQPLLEQLLAEQTGGGGKPFFPRGASPPLSPGARSISSVSSATLGDIVEPDIHLPLWRRFDRRFFWNEWLMRDFIDLGLHAYVLPIAQGWVQAATFQVPVPPAPSEADEAPTSVPVDIAVISRRSKDRAGLRYQRRGIDDDGHVANFVETEMLVRGHINGKVSLFSFVQTRGSIPLKWSQAPWSMKPPPVLDQPVDQTFSVANLHFDDLRQRYHHTTAINLSEQHGREAAVTNGYTELVKDLDRPDITYISFDFHEHCKGMNWANISDLIQQLDFAKMGYLWSLQGDVVKEQHGVFRTNCIDCLDRTNVVQSAIARHVLTQMLQQLGLVVEPGTSNLEFVFNDIWANNGDMISMCYAHTTALKGDFVRTGKRDISGMLNDGVSSLSRMFYGAVTDFFAQAVISFMLGHRNLGVFNEFLETLQTTERSTLVKQSRIRAAAIETSSARVLSEGEHRVAGWTLLSPEERNVTLSPKLEEKVLLLTKQALYVVSFNYTLEKVNEFTRIPLKSITSMQKGAYILSALQEAARDPVENAGFVVHFSPADESTRYSTYSIRNKGADAPAGQPRSPTKKPATTGSQSSPSAGKRTPRATPLSDSPSTASPTTTNSSAQTPNAVMRLAEIDPDADEFFAFKAFPREFVAGRRRRSAPTTTIMSDDDDDDDLDVGLEENETCATTVDRIVRRIRDQCARTRSLPDDFVLDKDVVSVADAESHTSLLDRMDYAVKRFLWL